MTNKKVFELQKEVFRIDSKKNKIFFEQNILFFLYFSMPKTAFRSLQKYYLSDLDPTGHNIPLKVENMSYTILNKFRGRQI